MPSDTKDQPNVRRVMEIHGGNVKEPTLKTHGDLLF